MPQAEHESQDRAPAGAASVAAEHNAARVLIIGAGAAGLSTAGALKKLGVAATVL